MRRWTMKRLAFGSSGDPNFWKKNIFSLFLTYILFPNFQIGFELAYKKIYI